MQTEQKNWVDDFRINEDLHSYAQELAAIYSRLRLNNKNHPEFSHWEKERNKWVDYNQSIKDMVIASEEQAFKEVERLGKEVRKILELEKTLSNNKPL